METSMCHQNLFTKKRLGYILLLVIVSFLFCNDEDTEDTTNFWEKTGGQITGTVQSMAVNENDYVFAGVTGQGIYRSKDDGSSWEQVNNGLPTSATMTAIVVDSKNNIYASELNEGIFLSTDQGNNWVKKSKGTLDSQKIYSLVVNLKDHIFAGTYEKGVFLSTDKGETWTQTAFDDLWANALAINSKDDVFIGTAGNVAGMYRLNSTGTSFNPINTGLPDPYTVHAIVVNTNDQIFIGAYQEGIYKSTDNGENWISINNQGLPDNKFNIHSLTLNSNNHIFAGNGDGAGANANGGVYYSKDNGNTWILDNSGFPNGYVYSLATNSNDYIFVGTSNIGIYKSTNKTCRNYSEVSIVGN